MTTAKATSKPFNEAENVAGCWICFQQFLSAAFPLQTFPSTHPNLRGSNRDQYQLPVPKPEQGSGYIRETGKCLSDRNKHDERIHQQLLVVTNTRPTIRSEPKLIQTCSILWPFSQTRCAASGTAQQPDVWDERPKVEERDPHDLEMKSKTCCIAISLNLERGKLATILRGCLHVSQ